MEDPAKREYEEFLWIEKQRKAAADAQRQSGALIEAEEEKNRQLIDEGEEKARRFVRTNETEILHYIMTFVGGFMGLYAICCYGSYASSVTGNLMSLIVSLVGTNFSDVLIRLGAYFMYCAGIGVSWLMIRFTVLPMRQLCIAVDIIAIAFPMALVGHVDKFILLYPIFFATSFQWGTFDGVGKHKSASLFLTGNTKSCIHCWLEYLTKKNKGMVDGVRLYSLTILFYMLGGFMGCKCVFAYGFSGGFYGFIPLAVAEIVLLNDYIQSRDKQCFRGK